MSEKSGNTKAPSSQLLIKVPLLFRFFYLLVRKTEACLKYFLNKNSQEQPLWVC